jgi:hypothetical protein
MERNLCHSVKNKCHSPKHEKDFKNVQNVWYDSISCTNQIYSLVVNSCFITLVPSQESYPIYEYYPDMYRIEEMTPPVHFCIAVMIHGPSKFISLGPLFLQCINFFWPTFSSFVHSSCPVLYVGVHKLVCPSYSFVLSSYVAYLLVLMLWTQCNIINIILQFK